MLKFLSLRTISLSTSLTKKALLLPPDGYFLTMFSTLEDVREIYLAAASKLALDFQVFIKFRSSNQFRLFPLPPQTADLGFEKLKKEQLVGFNLVVGPLNSLSYEAHILGVPFKYLRYETRPDLNGFFNPEAFKWLETNFEEYAIP